MNIQNPENQYRPIPFWSWNEKLNTDETKRQIELMHSAGLGGYFMHARGGLQTEYMGKEWFENIEVGIQEGKKQGMAPWVYDENGWPSGFGNGRVCNKGLAYQQKNLRMEKGEKQTEHTIGNYGGYHFYYDVNPFYVDTLDGQVTKVFLEEIYQPYYEKYKNDIMGFFTDEPQISRDGIPWSFILPAEYEEAYGDALLPHLPELFKPVGEYKKTRFRFWKLITDLFSKNYMKQLYDWCDSRGLKLTGHLLHEENMLAQVETNGAIMPHYEYFHIPGIDRLSRRMGAGLSMHQVCSVAHQLGKKQILTESFAMWGHTIGFNDMKKLLEWQMVRGVTLLCQHLEGYSLRGIRKRDYPPAMFYQQPWWDDYKSFNDAMSRIGMLLTEGDVHFDTLLLHPQSTAWICYDNGENEGIRTCNDALLDIIKKLEAKHILFHLGDETILERHARVEGASLVVGQQRYTTIIVPPHEILFENTQRLLEAYKANGGVIQTAEELDENRVISCPEITYTKRSMADFDLHYFVNSTNNTYSADVFVGDRMLDIVTGEEKPFYGQHVFKPFTSLVVLDTGKSRGQKPAEKQLQTLDLGGQWDIAEKSMNALTLDYCDYYFDDELIEQNGYVLNIQQRACALKRHVTIRCEYNVEVDWVPQEVYLVCETPDLFSVLVNDRLLDKTDCGFYIDKAFRKLMLTPYLKKGQNKIVLTIPFVQSKETYQNLEDALLCECVRNKLTYDVEVEPVYLVGDFGVRTTGRFQALDRDAVRYQGNFAITEPISRCSLRNLEQQCFPFFAGSLTLRKSINLDSTEYAIRLKKKGVNVIEVTVNGKQAGKLFWEPLELDVSHLLHVGQNEIEIKVINNLRNLLGPHHLEEGDCPGVSPWKFYKEKCPWGQQPEGDWNDDYCFIEFGLEQGE